jgi:hypothetical protein
LLLYIGLSQFIYYLPHKGDEATAKREMALCSWLKVAYGQNTAACQGPRPGLVHCMCALDVVTKLPHNISVR